MRFLIIPTPAPAEGDPPAPTEQPFDEALFTAYMKFNEEMHKAGVLVASEGLQPGVTGAHVKVTRGKRTVLDGPFTESKELVAGFWLIDVPSKKEAIEWALRAPVGPVDEILEVRQLTGAEDLPAELVAMIKAAAPEWSASWEARERR